MQSDADSSSLRRLTLSAQFGFFVIGIICVLLGLVLPILSERLSLNDAQAGTLFLAQFSGSITGTLFSGRLIRRLGFADSLLIGFVLMVVGIPGLNAWDLTLCRLAIFTYGLGLGIAIPATNLLAIELTPLSERVAAANFINFCWGLGAIASQPFVGLLAFGGNLLPVTLVLDGALIAVGVLLVFSGRGVEHKTEFADSGRISIARIWSSPLAWLIAAFNFLNIGVESGLGGWLTTYSERLEAEGKMWLNSTIVFFTFLVIGRGLAAIASRRLSENRLLLICSLILTLGVALILMTGSPAIPILGAATAGLGTSAIFPTNMVRFARIFGTEATRNAMPLFIMGTIGGATLSWMVGFVSTRSGRLETGIVVLLAAAALLTVLQILFCFTPFTRVPGARHETTETTGT